MGLGTLFSNTIGSANTAIGTASMQLNIAGSKNTTLGINAGRLNGALFPFSTGGNNNTFIGASADSSNLIGNNITALGYQAGYINNGSNNTYLGANTDGIFNNLNWAGAIGSNAKVSTNNALTLGATDAGSTPARTQSVFVGINVTDPTQRIDFRNGHIRNRQDVLPGVSITTASGITSAAALVGSSDVRGQITMTGANSASGTTVIHITFAYPCTNPPYVMISPANQTAGFYDFWTENITTAGFDLHFRAPFPGLSVVAPAYNYMIME
jgi:hypothetical protein